MFAIKTQSAGHHAAFWSFKSDAVGSHPLLLGDSLLFALAIKNFCAVHLAEAFKTTRLNESDRSIAAHVTKVSVESRERQS